MSVPIRIASRLGKIKPSITLAVAAKAARMRARGVDVISFGAGEPDFDTPVHIKNAVRDALIDGDVSGYTPVGGIPPLCAAVADMLNGVHGTNLEAEHVLVSCGAKHSLFNIFMSILDPGDEVIIPAPYWVSYPAMVKLAEGEPVIVRSAAEDGFCVEPEAIRAALTDRTRAIVLNTPSNPTGALYDRARLEVIATIALEQNLLIVSDDIYRSLVYGDACYTSVASLSPEVAARTILVDGVSKAYAMTGWRIGFTAGPVELIKGMSKIQGQSTSNPSHIAQVAALVAITGSQDCVRDMREAFDERRKQMLALLRDIPGVDCNEPMGAFYTFPDLSAFIGKKTPDGHVLDTDVALCGYLVEHGHIALVPGSGFGAPGFARLSYACSMEDIEKGLERLRTALAALA